MIRALRESPHLTPFVVITGQHADMVLPVLKMAGIEPDVDLHVGRPKNTLNGLVADVVTAFDTLTGELRANDPQREIPITAACLVHGDTTSAFAAALAAVQVGLPVVHVEAGLRTGDALSPFPEELNRQMIGRIASFHLAPTTHNLQNLVREKIPANRIFVTGNTGIDALRWVDALIDHYKAINTPDKALYWVQQEIKTCIAIGEFPDNDGTRFVEARNQLLRVDDKL